MSRLALSLLGPPRIERDGVVIEVDTRKAIALIAYLAVTRQRHSRDALAALLWPEYDQSHARATLRRTLSTLNKALNGPWLEVDRETIALNRNSDLQIDVNGFHELLAECQSHHHKPGETCSACIDPLAKAVALYQGDFLAGFSLRDSPNFDDWQFYQADSVRRDLAGALERLVYCHSSQGNFDPAIAYARRWLSLDRLHEPAHRQLMQLYAWAGQRAAALHQYRECVQVLEQELGVAPLEPTPRLYQSIKENSAPPPPVQSKSSVALINEERAGDTTAATTTATLIASPLAPATGYTLPGSTYPFLGRTAEWSTLTHAYDSIGTEGSLVILEGEAGIGKTRLAEEFLSSLRTKGASVIAARCYEGETHLAYGPIVTGLRTAIAQKRNTRWLEAVSTPWLSEAARLLPELATFRPGLPPAPPLDSPGAQTRFFEGLRHILLALCAGNYPGIIFFDDVHWADGASLDLLSYLVRRIQEQPLFLIITWRSKQASNEQRLQHLLTEAQRFGKATIVSLSRLTKPTVRELVQSVATTGDALPLELAERLYQETEGLPFFLVEYLTAMAKGILSAGNDSWSLPGGVRDLLRSRLVDVSEVGWQLLNTAAVIGRSFDFDTLRDASGRSEEETIIALEELIAQGLIEEVHDNTGQGMLNYDFCHEKLRSLVYEETSLARRRLLHRRVADVLVEHMRGQRETGILPGQIAHHFQMAGNEVAAAEYFKQAGERARLLYANTEALAHLRLALALGHPDIARLHEAIGDLHTFLGEYSLAIKSYETAAALCNADDTNAIAIIEHKLGEVYTRRGEWELAESHLEAALHASGETGPAGERARVYADWSLTAYHRGQTATALDLANQALALAEIADDTRGLAQAHNILGILASSKGDTQNALHHLQQSLTLAERMNDPATRVAALNNLALAYGANSEIDQAVALEETALALCAALGDRHREAALHNNLADLLHAAGQAEKAMSHLKQAVSIYAEIGVEAGTVQPEIWKLVEW